MPDRNGWMGRIEAPAEIEEERKAGPVLDVRVPVTQAAWAAGAWGVLFLVLQLSFLFWGWRAMLLFWLVFGVAAFIWMMVVNARYYREYESGSVGPALILRDVVTAVLVAAFPGGLAWCLWEALLFIAPGAANWPLWLRQIGAFLSVPVIVTTTVFALLLSLAFVQELAQRSPFQERHVWEAIGGLITHHGKRWQPERERVITVHAGGRARALPEPQYQAATIEPPAEQPERLTELEAFILLAGREETLSRRRLAGKEYGGWTFSSDSIKRLVGQLVDLGYVDTSPGVEAEWGGGWSPAAVMAQLSPSPTPQRGGSGRIPPASPTPPDHPPTQPTEEEEENGETKSDD